MEENAVGIAATVSEELVATDTNRRRLLQCRHVRASSGPGDTGYGSVAGGNESAGDRDKDGKYHDTCTGDFAVDENDVGDGNVADKGEANDNNNQLEYLSQSCSTNKTFPPNTTYKSNLHTLLTSFSSVAATAEFYNTNSSGGDAAGETIYGMFMCRGDIKSQKCQKCIEMATQKIALSCPNSKEAIIWYHECMVRYSNRSFFSTVDEWPRPKYISHHETSNITTEGSYGWLLATTLNDAIAEAAKSANANKKFATKHVSLGGSQNVYTLVQCTPDLSSQDCSKCLNDVMKDIPICCLGTDGGMVLYPSCNLMFGLHRFYSDANLPINCIVDNIMSFLKLILFNYLCFFLTLITTFNLFITEASNNNNHSNDLDYLKCDCLNNKTISPIIPTTIYKSNLQTLLTSLSSHAATAGFNNATAAGGHPNETIYGMYMCRGDVSNQTCQECVETAKQEIGSRCGNNSKEAIIWYHQCFLRYSNRSFFSTLDEWPRLEYIVHNNGSNAGNEGSYGWLLASTLNEAIEEAKSKMKKFATKHASLNGSKNVYTLVQCTQDLRREDCSKCLNDLMKDIPMCCLGTDGGMVLSPCCNLMFGLRQFYSNVTIRTTWNSLPNSRLGKYQTKLSVYM
ncbi:putative cysteine-rich receptor-like protein kinase 23 [Arachis stenosperma]|uniref:putative cysteine-rich receptor-like protein kinase 23 n=1 Tax=Arachis stenosperma TaxID=217475 RepID=UPI0025AD1657|nr:putative cysteine-rich receptor-like protein kinase 23 [Arachis stenosperma]